MLAVDMGVTTALVLAIFVGVYWPQAIRNRKQFNFAIGAVLLIILFEVLDALIGINFHRFAVVMEGLLQIVGILSIILAASGQSMAEFAVDTIEVVRRGEDEPEVLIKGAGTKRARERDAVDEGGRIDLGSTDVLQGKPPLRQNAPPPPPPAAAGSGSIPLDE
jgi:hypothetical protein